MTSTWTLPNIITKVRNITGSASPDQLTDIQITDYINKYYAFTMPHELKEQIQLAYYDFTTVPNQDTYAFDGVDFLTNQPTCWVDGHLTPYYQDPNIFWKWFPQVYNNDPVGSGNGSQKLFTGGLQATPVIPGTAFITDGQISDPNLSLTAQTFYDKLSDGNFYASTNGGLTVTGASVGTLDYSTGAFSITFPVAPATGTAPYCKYEVLVPTLPQGILFFEGNLTLRPPPDQVYQVRLQAYTSVHQLDLTSPAPQTPTFQEWGQLLAYGASIDIFADRGDTQGRLENFDLLQRYEGVALSRFIQQMETSRPFPRW